MAFSDITYPGPGGGGGGSERRANLIVKVEAFTDITTFSDFTITFNGVDVHSLSEYIVPDVGYELGPASPAADTAYVFKCLIPNPQDVTGIGVAGDSSHSTGWDILWTVTGEEVSIATTSNGGGGGFSNQFDPFGTVTWSATTPLYINIRPQ
jgi:hypothetical protein